MAIETQLQDGVAEIIINNPPVNALGSAGWREFADAVTSQGARDDVNCLVIRAEGASQAIRYLRGVRLDGLPIEGSTVRHADLVAGDVELRFDLSDEP